MYSKSNFQPRLSYPRNSLPKGDFITQDKKFIPPPSHFSAWVEIRSNNLYYVH